jgi:proline iminopeptidase
MMMDVPAYNAYARDVLMPEMDQQALSEIQALEVAGDYQNPRFMELLMEHHYVHHVLRMPAAEWPDPARRGFDHLNLAVYVKMQGPSELGISASATLAAWSRFDDLGRIDAPTLVIGAAHDTMDPEHMRDVARRLPHGTYLHCPQGSHMAMYDDQETYFRGLISWLNRLGPRQSP